MSKKKRGFAGFDCHKETHHCVVIGLDGEILSSFEVINTYEGLSDCLSVLKNISKTFHLKIGIEGSKNFGIHLSRILLDNGFDEVYEVPTNYTKSRRGRTSGHGKSDEKDAEIIARITRDEKDLPLVKFNDDFDALSNFTRRREELIKFQTQEYLRLHAALKDFDLNYSSKGQMRAKKTKLLWKDICIGTLRDSKNKYLRAQAIYILKILNSLEWIISEIKDLEKLMKEFATEEVEILQSMPGVALINACSLVSKIKDISRFKNANKLASYSGHAPVTYASGMGSVTKLNLRGHRQLNYLIDSIALTACRCDEISRMYYDQKLKEGKTRKQARRYLARRLVNVIFALLKKKEKYNPDYPSCCRLFYSSLVHRKKSWITTTNKKSK